LIIINQFLWLSTNCFFSSSVHEHAWFCAFQSLGHPGHLDYRLFFFYVFFILHAFFILDMTLGLWQNFLKLYCLQHLRGAWTNEWLCALQSLGRPGRMYHTLFSLFSLFFMHFSAWYELGTWYKIFGCCFVLKSSLCLIF